MNVSIVKHTDTGEVKLFSGGELIGRYKSENDALAHLSTALVELTAAQQRVTGYVDQIKLLQAEVDELRAIKFKRFSDQECWIYQGDGEDHLESLVCPVVMSTEQAIKFEHAQQRVAELEREGDLVVSLYKQSEKECQELTTENARLLKRVNDLETAIANGMNDAARMVDRNGWLESEHQRLKQRVERLTATNARLRELLRVCKNRLHMFPQLCIEIKAELAKGE